MIAATAQHLRAWVAGCVTARVRLSECEADVTGDDPLGCVWITRAGGGLYPWPLTSEDRVRVRRAITEALSRSEAA